MLTWLVGSMVAAFWSVATVQAEERYIASLDTPWSGVARGQSEPMIGQASVIDGDTLEIAGERIELAGIDAPEMDQTCQVIIFSWDCGEDATKFLSSLVAGREVSCLAVGRDTADRPHAVCSTETAELNETLVRIGMALALPETQTSYVDDEVFARDEEVGVWRSSFDPPWEWRADNLDEDDVENQSYEIRPAKR